MAKITEDCGRMNVSPNDHAATMKQAYEIKERLSLVANELDAAMREAEREARNSFKVV